LRGILVLRTGLHASATSKHTSTSVDVARTIKAVPQLLWPDKDREVPGFPVKFVGVDKLHAAFLNESRTRGRCLVPRTGNPGVWFSLEENHEEAHRFPDFL
jgi:hypothetical protein